MSKEVVILGAGPAGLAAGLFLARNGIRPVVIEKENYVAGLCRTLSDGDFSFDIGGHRWFTKNEEVDRFVKDLMGAEFIRVPRLSRIYFNGKFFLYPISIGNVLRNLGLRQSILAVLSFLRSQWSVGQQPETMEQAYITQFGRKIYELFFRNYSEKVWGRKCSELSADWVAQRTRGLSVFGLLERALLRRNAVESLVEEFWYPRRGYGRISERMSEEIVCLGGEVRLGEKVTRILRGEDRITGVQVTSKDGSTGILPADSVISTIPLTLLMRMMEPDPPLEILQAAGRLQFRDLITINLKLNRDRVTEDTWMYIHDPEIPFARLHEPRNWSRDMVPEGQTSLVVEYFCDLGDPLWSRSDEELCDMTVGHLCDKLGFIHRNEVVGSFAFRARRAYPVYSLDYSANLDCIKKYVETVSGLQIIGRGGTFRYNNSDHSIEMGILAARNVLGENHSIDSVNSEQEYLEEKRARAPVTSYAPAD